MMKLQFSAMDAANRHPAHVCKMIPLNIDGVQGTTWPILLVMLRLPVSSLQTRSVLAFCLFLHVPLHWLSIFNWVQFVCSLKAVQCSCSVHSRVTEVVCRQSLASPLLFRALHKTDQFWWQERTTLITKNVLILMEPPTKVVYLWEQGQVMASTELMAHPDPLQLSVTHERKEWVPRAACHYYTSNPSRSYNLKPKSGQ